MLMRQCPIIYNIFNQPCYNDVKEILNGTLFSKGWNCSNKTKFHFLFAYHFLQIIFLQQDLKSNLNLNVLRGALQIQVNTWQLKNVIFYSTMLTHLYDKKTYYFLILSLFWKLKTKWPLRTSESAIFVIYDNLY